MAKTASKTASPTIKKRTVAMPVRPKNADVRTREYLTDDEVQRLTEAAKANRHGHRCQIASNCDPFSRPITTPYQHANVPL